MVLSQPPQKWVSGPFLAGNAPWTEGKEGIELQRISYLPATGGGRIIKQGSHQNSICRNSLHKSPFTTPTCNWRRNNTHPGAEGGNWVVKHAGIITARQTPVVLLKTDLKIEWIDFKSIYACLHVAVQQIQDVLAASQCPIFFSHPVRPRVSKGSHVANCSHLWFVFWLRQYLRLYNNRRV
jgi:hypothetical protein